MILVHLFIESGVKGISDGDLPRPMGRSVIACSVTCAEGSLACYTTGEAFGRGLGRHRLCGKAPTPLCSTSGSLRMRSIAVL